MNKTESKQYKLILTHQLKRFDFVGTPKTWPSGRKSNTQAQDQGVSLTMDLIKSVILQYPICQHIKHRSLL